MTVALASPSSEKKATAQLAALARARGDVATAERYQAKYAQLPDDEPWPDPFLAPVFQSGVGRRFRILEVENLESDNRFTEAAALYLERAEREPTAAAYAGAGFDLARAGQLDQAVTRFERDYGIPEGSTALLPNIEFARGLVQTVAIARVSKRTTACLLASEDLAADLGAERGIDGVELAYCRQRFIVECVAAGVVAVDCPYTWSDVAGVERDTRWARRLGYAAKSLVDPAHAGVINGILAPDRDELGRARDIVTAFEAARAAGKARVELDGSLIEVPTYHTAKRLLARGEAMRQFERVTTA